jgi:hypothetical protein
MGVSGIDLDIVTGRPRQRKTQEERQQELDLREQKAVAEASALGQDLPAVLPIMAGLLEQRLVELMNQDGFCVGILKQAAAYNMKLSLAPAVAQKIRRQSFGIVLNSLTDETKVAPPGIPTEE